MRGSSRKWAACVFVVGVLLGMGWSGLRAQSITRGRFTIPFNAEMGNLTLPNGDYMFSVNRLATDGLISIYQGTQGIALLRPESFSTYEAGGENPVLIFVRHDGSATLRALVLPKRGTFYFPLPKQLKTLMAQQPQLIETVVAQVSGD